MIPKTTLLPKTRAPVWDVKTARGGQAEKAAQKAEETGHLDFGKNSGEVGQLSRKNWS